MTARYFAEIDNEGQVVRVVVADDSQWLVERLGGTWVETLIDGAEQYAGIGFFHDSSSQWKFAPAWVQPVGSEDAYPVGSYVYHDGQIWQSKLPANVWEPGVVGWRDPISEIPKWVQPSGSEDAYQLGDRVFWNGKEWESNLNANVWEPGAVGVTQWDDITEPPPSDEWQAGKTYQVGDTVTYLENTYECIQGHTSQVGWHPPAVPSLWSLVTE